MKCLLLLPLLVLAGCSWFSGPETVAEDTRPEYVACRREAANSPEVRAFAERTNTENAVNAYRLGPERERTQNRLYRDCLRRAGLALPGGVESLRQR